MTTRLSQALNGKLDFSVSLFLTALFFGFSTQDHQTNRPYRRQPLHDGDAIYSQCFRELSAHCIVASVGAAVDVVRKDWTQVNSVHS